MDHIEKRLSEIMSEVFQVPIEKIDSESSQDNISNWDSLSHFDLIITIEEAWGITIPVEEIGSMTSMKIISLILKELTAS